MNFNEFYLLEITSDEKYQKQYAGKLNRVLFDKAVLLDPTSKGKEKAGKFVDWIIRNHAFDNNEVTDLLSKYEKYKEKFDITKRDINKLKYDDLKELIASMEEKGSLVSKKDQQTINREKAENESEIVFNDSKYIIIVPNTKFASQYYGANADWCTARQDDRNCLFDRYADNGKLYIVKDKQTNKKYQLYLSNDLKEYEYRNVKNQAINPFEKFSDDKALIKFLNDNEFPDQSHLTEEQVDELAERLVNLCGIREKYDEAYSIAKESIESRFYYDDYGEDINMYDYAYDEVNRWSGNFYYLMAELESEYYIDPDNIDNKLFVLSYADMDDFGEFDKEYMKRNEWIYKYSDMPLSDIVELFEDNDNDYKLIESWLKQQYQDETDDFKDFPENFIAAYENKYKHHKLLDNEKEELMNIKNKIKSTEYNKLKQPELELAHTTFKKHYVKN